MDWIDSNMINFIRETSAKTGNSNINAIIEVGDINYQIRELVNMRRKIKKMVYPENVSADRFRSFIVNSVEDNTLRYTYRYSSISREHSSIQYNYKVIKQILNKNGKDGKNASALAESSTRSLIGWTNIDLSLHAIGSAEDIADVFVNIITGDYPIPKYMQNIFIPYFNVENAFKDVIIYGFEREISKPEGGSSIWTYHVLPEYIIRCRSSGNLRLMADLMIIICMQLEKELRMKYIRVFHSNVGKRYEFQFINLQKSLETLIRHLTAVFRKYFDYNEIDAPKNEAAFTVNKYPIVLEGQLINRADTKKRLIGIFRENTVGLDGKQIYLAGSIQEPSIAIYLYEPIIRYFNSKYKKNNEKTDLINQILDNMSKKIHIVEMKKMREKIKKYFKLVNDSTTTKDEQANITVRLIAEEYKKIRQRQIKLGSYLGKIEIVKPTKIEMISELLELKDILMIEIGHTQVKGDAYKNLAIDICGNYFFRENQSKYCDILKSGLRDVDDWFNSKNKMNNSGNDYSFIIEYLGDQWKNVISNMETKKFFNNKSVLINNININSNTLNINSNTLDVENNITKSIKNNQTVDIATTEKFWLDLRKKLGGKTILVPYLEANKFSKDEYGLYDLMETAIRGYVSKRFIYKNIDMSYLSKVISARGMILVDKDTTENPNEWRCILRSILDTIGKLSTTDLRKYIYTMFTKSDIYVKRASVLWTGDIRDKVAKYCRITGEYSKCNILISHKSLSNLFP